MLYRDTLEKEIVVLNARMSKHEVQHAGAETPASFFSNLTKHHSSSKRTNTCELVSKYKNEE
jgi:hypothetical protein